MHYDIIIVGAGTAGLSAAIYALRAGKTVLVLEGTAYGGQIINTPDIENYPGIAHISGFDFATELYQQAKDLGAKIKMERVAALEDAGDVKHVKVLTGSGGGEPFAYGCKAVILATGAKNRPLGLPGEDGLVGRGLSYCATCDGMFFRNKTVAVNGGGNTAVEDARFLSAYCKKVYIIHRRDQFRADEREVQKLREKENVEFILHAAISGLRSDASGLCGIEISDKLSGEKKELPLDGLFVAIGQMPDNAAFSAFVDLDDKGYIVAKEDCRSKTAWVFAAGDCRTKTVRQLTTAAADGAVAALAACAYIDGLPAPDAA